MCPCPIDHGAGAETGRSQHSRVREEQEGVHRAHGEVAHREGRGPADGEPGAGFLRGTPRER